jgi:hypothetical protein
MPVDLLSYAVAFPSPTLALERFSFHELDKASFALRTVIRLFFGFEVMRALDATELTHDPSPPKEICVFFSCISDYTEKRSLREG